MSENFRLRSSLLRQAFLSPRTCEAMLHKGYVVTQTAPMAKGQITHTAILESAKFSNCFEIKEPRKGREFSYNSEGKIMLNQSTVDEVMAMVGEFYSYEELGKLIASAKYIEQDFTAEYKGYLLTAKPDIISAGDILIDYKTTSGLKKNWLWAAVDSGYDLQFAHYHKVLELNGMEIKKWQHIVQETKFPYEIKVYTYDTDFIARSREKWEEVLDIFTTIYNGTYVFELPKELIGFKKESFDDESYGINLCDEMLADLGDGHE